MPLTPQQIMAFRMRQRPNDMLSRLQNADENTDQLENERLLQQDPRAVERTKPLQDMLASLQEVNQGVQPASGNPVAGMEADVLKDDIDLRNLQNANAAARRPGSPGYGYSRGSEWIDDTLAARRRGNDPSTGMGPHGRRGEVANVRGVDRSIAISAAKTPEQMKKMLDALPMKQALEEMKRQGVDESGNRVAMQNVLAGKAAQKEVERKRELRLAGGEGPEAGLPLHDAAEAAIAAQAPRRAAFAVAEQQARDLKNPRLAMMRSLQQGGGGIGGGNDSGLKGELIRRMLGLEPADPRAQISRDTLAAAASEGKATREATATEGKETRAATANLANIKAMQDFMTAVANNKTAERGQDKQVESAGIMAGAGQEFTISQKGQEAWDADFYAEKSTAPPNTPDSVIRQKVEARRGPRPSLKGKVRDEQAVTAPTTTPQTTAPTKMDQKQAANATLAMHPEYTFRQFVMAHPEIGEDDLAQIWKENEKGDPYEKGFWEEKFQYGNPLNEKFTGFGSRDFWKSAISPWFPYGHYVIPSTKKPKIRQP